MPPFGSSFVTGGSSTVPTYGRRRNRGGSQQFADIRFLEHARSLRDFVEDFEGVVPSYTLTMPLYDGTADANKQLQAVNSRATLMAPRAGILQEVSYVAEDALVQDATNILTFTLTNKLGTGLGSTAMLAAVDGNTTKTTTGFAIVANRPQALVVSATAAALRVSAGDDLVGLASPVSLANTIDLPSYLIKIATLPSRWNPRTQHTAGLPLVGPVVGTANGEAICALSSTNEVMGAFADWGDQVAIPSSGQTLFWARVKFGTYGANETAIVGLTSAWNATLASMTQRCAFRLSGDMVLKAETDDGTTDSGLISTGLTVVAGTYYLLRIDMSDTGNVTFWVDERPLAVLSAPAFTTSSALLQPMFGVQKASGTGVPDLTVDYLRVLHARA